VTSTRDLVVGEVIAGLAFDGLNEGGSSESGPMLVRVKGLHRDEIKAAAHALAKRASEKSVDIRIKISSREVWPDCPPEWFLGEGETRAQLRNAKGGDLALFDSEKESDEQSFSNFHTVSDSWVLGTVAEDGPLRRAELIRTIWSRERGGGAAPATLIECCEELFGIYIAAESELPLRSWLGFLMRVCWELLDASQVVDATEVKAAVASALPELSLFPDYDLYAESSAVTRRRIARNIRYSQFQTSGGAEVEEEALEKIIRSTHFKDADGVLVDSKGNKEWQKACLSLLESSSDTARETIPYSIWAQLFEKESSSKKLGDVVREQIQNRAGSRAEELEELEVCDSLNEGGGDAAEAAERLLKAAPDDDNAPPLASLLTAGVRKKLERLAYPRQPEVTDPLTTFLKYLHFGVQDHVPDGKSADGLVLGLSLDERRAINCDLSIVLFQLLYGATLASLEAEEDTESGRRIQVDDRLKVASNCCGGLVAMAAKALAGEDAEFDPTHHWAPVPLAVTVGEATVQSFQWSPERMEGHVLLARLLTLAESWDEISSPSDSFDDLCGRASDLTQPIPALESSLNDVPEYMSDWKQQRSDFRSAVSVGGLQVDAIRDYVDAWQEVLRRVRSEEIPQGSRNVVLDWFLDLDTGKFKDDRTVMLATHPIRLRWVADYLELSSKRLGQLVRGEFRLCEGAEDFYFEQQLSFSPHRQPPILSEAHGSLSLASRETCWHEEFARIEHGNASSQDWAAALDDSSMDAMEGIVESYLQAHPHKQDGLSLLFVAATGEVTHVERVIRRVLKSRSGGAGIVLRVFVIAPSSAHDAMARTLEALDDSLRSPERLLPRVQSFLLPDDALSDFRSSELNGRIDLALVPNLFGKKTVVDRQSRKSPRLQGAHRPLFDPASYDLNSEGGAQSENVSRAMVPERGDFLLESWSTLCVRRKTESTVTQDGDDETDLFALSVRFTESLELFRELHKWAHWVVTLDAFIGREQIEAIENKPDIITVKPRVGKNGNYTLVVSSDAGREFVKSRLAVKLSKDLGVVSAKSASDLASKLYDNGRYFAPGVVLRALGLGHTSQELIGLVVSRWAIEERFPKPDATFVFEAWISLDEHSRWFGGIQAQRADLLRLVAHRDPDSGRLFIAPYIVESKFRSTEFIGTAETQVTATIELLGRAFRGRQGEDEEAADANFWRRELLDALQQSASRSGRGAVFSGLRLPGESDGSGLPARVRLEILEGEYEYLPPTGLICSVAYASEAPISPTTIRESGYHWLQVARPEMKRILQAFGLGECPMPTGALVGGAGKVPTPEPLPPPREGPGRIAPPTGGAPDPPPTTSNDPVAARAGIGEEGLRERYRRVLDVFSEFNVTVSKPSDGELFLEGPGFYQVRIQPGRGVKSESVMSQASELKLKLGLAAEHKIRAYVDRGAVMFEIPKSGDERYPVIANNLWKRHEASPDRLEVPIGEDIHGQPVILNFSSSDTPHLLIGGTTGSGKSVVMEAILGGLCRAYDPSRLRLMLVDPKGTELLDFENSPHLEGEIGLFAEDAIELLEREAAEMDRRYQLLRDKRTKSIAQYNDLVSEEERLPWHLVVLDEYADLTGDKQDRAKIEGQLKRLAQKARAAGIHVIVATQKPSAEILSTAIRSNLPAQLALRVKTASDSRMIIEEQGAESLSGKGDAFFKTAEGTLRIQCAMIAREP
jgi:S-DNA-T family DNA segregation ATPase FtsK/SpoIIIE